VRSPLGRLGAMKFIGYFIHATLLVAAVFHLLPATGLFGADRLAALYGVTIEDPGLLLLMRHRAMLFGLLGAFMLYAAWAGFVARVQPGNLPAPTSNPGLHPGYETWALVAGLVSTGSFVLLAWGSALNPLLLRVMWIDIALFVLLGGALAARLLILR